jgi:hypothetical protein
VLLAIAGLAGEGHPEASGGEAAPVRVVNAVEQAHDGAVKILLSLAAHVLELGGMRRPVAAGFLAHSHRRPDPPRDRLKTREIRAVTGDDAKVVLLNDRFVEAFSVFGQVLAVGA